MRLTRSLRSARMRIISLGKKMSISSDVRSDSAERCRKRSAKCRSAASGLPGCCHGNFPAASKDSARFAIRQPHAGPPNRKNCPGQIPLTFEPHSQPFETCYNGRHVTAVIEGGGGGGALFECNGQAAMLDELMQSRKAHAMAT